MKCLWLSFTVVVCLTASALAQVAPRPMRYDPSREVTVQGTVVEVRNMARPGPLYGTHLVLRTPLNTLDVHLGPQRLAASRAASLAAGESVEVVGCVVNQNGSPILLARQVRKGDTVLTFRSARGLPMASRKTRP